MQDKILYKYAIIRFVPKVEREEFLNVGVIMYAKRPKFLKVKYNLDEQKLKLFSTELDMDVLQHTLDSFEKICSGDQSAGVIAGLDHTERFGWLTAVRSACIQTSRPHPGFAADLNIELQRLFEEQVL